ncbi:MAG: pilus assembly protein [Rhizobiales bacterium]|nr:pilus assembly protein [Hyphomicrobiales bacterium]
MEFALVGFPFFFVLCCICETGIMLFAEYVLQNAAQDAARTVRTGQAVGADGSPPATAGDFKAIICDSVDFLIDCSGKVTVYVDNAPDFASLETVMGDPLAIGPGPMGEPYPVVFNPGARLRAATVVATYDWNFIFPFMDLLGNRANARRLYGMAIFRNEPF